MTVLTVKIKRLHPDAVIPQYAHVGDAGFDLVAVEDVIVEPGETVKVPTGIAIELPPGYELQIRPRSGITLRTKLRVQLGTVDSNYRGEIGVIVDNIAHKDCLSDGELLFTPLDITGGVAYDSGHYPYNSYIIRKGDKIAQGVIAPVATATFIETDELSDTTRGEGGFGSTGVSGKPIVTKDGVIA